ncbi:MAG: hypothetical protein K0R27_2495 [Xanthobacteraceae bacterium]|jgi:hypothetical protein|nr:hypothetical protein [Xanthobacteraceae bacterium]
MEDEELDVSEIELDSRALDAAVNAANEASRAGWDVRADCRGARTAVTELLNQEPRDTQPLRFPVYVRQVIASGRVEHELDRLQTKIIEAERALDRGDIHRARVLLAT